MDTPNRHNFLIRPLSYADSGVDINSGLEFIDLIKPYANTTKRKELLSSIGGFSALFELDLTKYKNPIIVSTTDGVGTKVLLADDMQSYQCIGIDLVAMCVNDLIVQGAEPLFFLDYYATGKLNPYIAEYIIRGITQGCKLAGASLVGGETAELPDMYPTGVYDLAGFAVGVVDKFCIIDGSKVCPGDVILGLASSGIHANGFSLVRRVLKLWQINLEQYFTGKRLKDILLTPTRIYVKPILALLNEFNIHAIAHITGGGLIDNLPRVLPNNTQALIDTKSWEIPEIFNWIKALGRIDTLELFRVFNCGIGMAIVVPHDEAERIYLRLKSLGENVYRIGVITENPDSIPKVVLV